jgi:hypothetical protein
MKTPDRSEPAAKSARKRGTEGGVLGLGLDGSDGHQRVTKGDDFLLLGGSEQTHGRMQDLVLRMSEKLKRKGKSFHELSRTDFENLVRDSIQ